MNWLRWNLVLASALASVACSTPPTPMNDAGDVVTPDVQGTDVSPGDAPPADAPPADVTPDAPSRPMPNLVPILIAGNEPWLASIPLDIRQGYSFRAPQITNQAFAPASCEVQEGCTLPGNRRLLRFTLATPNRGDADLVLGSPTSGMRPPGQFEFSACHNHYHLRGYADYRLLDMAGHEVAAGHKQSFCIEDSTSDPNALIDPATGERYNVGLIASDAYACDNQGLHAGWLDAYGSHLQCQYIDITGVAPGRYRVRATINSDRILEESNYADNVTELEVTIPATTGNPPPATPLDACAGAESGVARECGWTTEPDPRTCTPGAMVTIGCNEACTPAMGRCEGNPVVRICASTRPCAGGSTGCTPSLPYCMAADALASNDDSCGTQCSQVTFACPASGFYRVLTGGFNAGDAYTCRLPFAAPMM